MCLECHIWQSRYLSLSHVITNGYRTPSSPSRTLDERGFDPVSVAEKEPENTTVLDVLRKRRKCTRFVFGEYRNGCTGTPRARCEDGYADPLRPVLGCHKPIQHQRDPCTSMPPFRHIAVPIVAGGVTATCAEKGTSPRVDVRSPGGLFHIEIHDGNRRYPRRRCPHEIRNIPNLAR